MTIETVDVGWCKEITDQGATLIAQSSKSLRYLGLMRCDKVRVTFRVNFVHISVANSWISSSLFPFTYVGMYVYRYICRYVCVHAHASTVNSYALEDAWAVSSNLTLYLHFSV